MAKKPFIFSNADKDGIHEDHDLKNLANHVRSSRIILAGSPGCGKSNIIKNIIINQKPKFEEIYIFHIDSNTKEYETSGAKICTDVSELPDLDNIDPENKCLIIYEDLDFTSMKQKDITLLDKFLRYGCTHKGCMIIIACQDYYTVPVSMRRKCSITYIFKTDEATASLYRRNLSITKIMFEYLIEKYLSSKYASLCLDMSGHPVILRSNMFTPIDKKEIELELKQKILMDKIQQRKHPSAFR